MDQSTRNRYSLGIGLVIVVLALAGYVIGRSPKAPPLGTSGASTTTPETASSTAAGTQGSVGVIRSGVQSSDQGLPTTIPEPDLARPYTPPAAAPVSVQAADRKAVSDAVAQLKIDPNHLAYWLQLAIYRKNAGDYTGAEEVWLYCTARWPQDPVSYNNLADLYENYLHDYAKAITYWNKLIALKPTPQSLGVGAFINLATLYNINLHDAAKAKATLQAGLVQYPNNPDILNALKALQG